ncbi:MAG: hypothetical protein WD229_01375, partial [Pirellulales bacterium]
RIYGVTLNYPVAGDTLQLGDLVDSSFEITGQVVATNADNAFMIQPDGAGIHNSSIRVQAVVGSNGSLDAAVRIDPSLADIQNNLFHVHEVNTGYFGIKIMNPSATTEFSSNLVRSLHTHATGHIGVQVGESATNAARIHSNTVEVRTNTDGVPAEVALQVWGDFNTLDLYAGNSGLNFGAKFEPGSNNNTLFFGPIQANTPIANFGTNNTFIPHGSGSGGGSSLSDSAEVDGSLEAASAADLSTRPAPTPRAALRTAFGIFDRRGDNSLLLIAAGKPLVGESQLVEAAIDAALDGRDDPTGFWPTFDLPFDEGLAVHWIQRVR